MVNTKIITNFAKFFHTYAIMGKFTEFKLPLKSIPVGSQEFEYKLNKQFFVNMENNDVRDADILVDLTVDHRNDCYTLYFKLDGEVVVACDRCLDDLHLPIDTEYSIVVKYGDDYDDSSDEFLVIPESDNYLNVAYMIHDTVALAIPIKHIHPLGKCNRAMSSLLKKHRAGASGEDTELEDSLIEEMDQMDDDPTMGATDSRWDKLKDFNPEA